MMPARARLWGPIALALFVACVWLNQSRGGDGFERYREGVLSAPLSHPLDTVRYPFAYIYRRAADVRLYFETSNMILGRPSDPAFVVKQRGHLPAKFAPVSFPPADGKWHAPYAEVPLEYPAPSLPFMFAPLAVASTYDPYGFAFGGLMGLCLVGAAVASLDTARAAGAGPDEVRRRAWLISGLLLAQGSMAVHRLDAVPALWVALAVRAAVRRQPLAFGAWMGLAAATKIVPVLMVPALLAADARLWRDARALVRIALGFTATLVAGIAPMFWFSRHALADVLSYHSMRGLHCESTFGLLLGIVRAIAGTTTPSALSFGSDNLRGPAADALAALCGPASVVAALALAWWTWRGTEEDPAREEDAGGRIACAAFASLVALWLTAKVFSPQYMSWGIPIVLAIPGVLGIRLAWLLLGAMALTQLYVCGHYELVRDGRPLGLLNLAARHAVLVVAGVVAARSLRRRSSVNPGTDRSPSSLVPDHGSSPPRPSPSP
jgi:hypothetical protein